MNWDHQKDRRLITGTGGSGKTTLFLSRIANSPERWKFLFDPEREIARKLRWPTCYDVPAMVKCTAAGAPVCFCPDPLFDDLHEGFEFFSAWVWEVCCVLTGPKLFGSDEVQDFTDGNAAGIPPAFRRIMQKGRRQEINVILITQTLGEAHSKIRNQLSHIYSFRHDDDLALTWLHKNGFDREAVGRLTYPGGWICRNRDTGEITTNEKAKAKPAGKTSGQAFVDGEKTVVHRGRAANQPASR